MEIDEKIWNGAIDALRRSKPYIDMLAQEEFELSRDINETTLSELKTVVEHLLFYEERLRPGSTASSRR